MLLLLHYLSYFQFFFFFLFCLTILVFGALFALVSLLFIEYILYSPPPPSFFHFVSVFCYGVETIPLLIGRNKLVSNLNNCASQLPLFMDTFLGKKGLCTKTDFNGLLSVRFHRIRSILTSSSLPAWESNGPLTDLSRVKEGERKKERGQHG